MEDVQIQNLLDWADESGSAVKALVGIIGQLRVQLAALSKDNAELNDRVAKLEGGARAPKPTFSDLVLDARNQRAKFFEANPTATYFRMEVLPGVTQVWERSNATNPVWTELDSRLRVNHNLTIQANTAGGVGAGGHAHLVLRVNRNDGKTQEFQMVAARDAGDRFVLAGQYLEPGVTDPIHALTRNDLANTFFWFEGDANGKATKATFGIQRRRLTPSIGEVVS